MRPVIIVVFTLAALLCADRAATAQTVIDRALVRVTGAVETVVTQLDVREARTLKLVDPSDATDAAIADALVDRRLMLADVARLTDLEPAADALEARRTQWGASLGAAVDVTALLARVGMSDAALNNWLRDDLRLQTYIGRRLLAGVQPTLPDQQRYYRDHPDEFTRDGIPSSFESVRDVIAAKLSKTNRTDAINRWVDSIRRRVDITVIR